MDLTTVLTLLEEWHRQHEAAGAGWCEISRGEQAALEELEDVIPAFVAEVRALLAAQAAQDVPAYVAHDAVTIYQTTGENVTVEIFGRKHTLPHGVVFAFPKE